MIYRAHINLLIVVFLVLFFITAGNCGELTERVSISTSGSQANNSSSNPAISADSRYVVFDSLASNLVPNDTNSQRDVFVRDRQTGTTTRVSVSSAGVQGNGWSFSPAISGDGRYIAFASGASNLVTGDTNARDDIFLHDRQTSETIRVSLTNSGLQANGGSGSPSLSSDGRLIAFYSDATNLVANDTNNVFDVFVRDRVAGTTTRVSVGAGGVQANGASRTPWISANGQFVAFVSSATNLVPGDTNSVDDIFVRNLTNNTIIRVSVSSSGTQANGPSFNPVISGNGRYVVFESSASNLVTNDTNGVFDIFLHDTQTGQTICISRAQDGTQANGQSRKPYISEDGTYVSFQSDATNLVPNDTNGKTDIFLYNIASGQIQRVSLGASNAQGDGDCNGSAVSVGGQSVTFVSASKNLVSGDTNNVEDIFVRFKAYEIELTNPSGGETFEIGQNVTITWAADGPAWHTGDTVSLHYSADNGNNWISIPGAQNLEYNLGSYIWDTTGLMPGSQNKIKVMFNGDATVFDISGSFTIVDATPPTIAHIPLTDTANMTGPYVVKATATDNVGIQNVKLYWRKNNNPDSMIEMLPTGNPNEYSGNIPGPAVDNDQFRYYITASDTSNNVKRLPESGYYLFTVSPQRTRKISVGFNGEQPNGDSDLPCISSDGRYVIFESDANNLTANDINNARDVFLYDRNTGQTTLISVSSAGVQGNLDSGTATVSVDGQTRRVAFGSWANNLVPSDTNDAVDVFVRDLVSMTTTRESVSGLGVQANGFSDDAVISRNGRYVAFWSSASNLLYGDTNGAWDVFRRDLETGQVLRVSVRGTATQANGHSSSPSISGDGRYIVFASEATNLVTGDTNEASDIFLRDMQTSVTTRVSVSSSGMQANGSSYGPKISPDGRYVAFRSQASNLVEGDTNGVDDIFVRDLHTNTTIRISQSSEGIQANGPSYSICFSADGRYVAFDSDASNLVPNDTNNCSDIFLYDMQTRKVRRLSLANDGSEANGPSHFPSLNDDGRYVAFYSAASNLVTGDTNGKRDVFVRDWGYDINIVYPNGGERFEIGDPINIIWETAGPAWRSGDLIRLEYSVDQGQNWTVVPGAGAIPYNSESFSWNTSDLVVGNNYRVRAVCLSDVQFRDSSDGNFSIFADDSPPVIQHIPLGNSISTAGPYRVSAFITDDTGVGSAQIIWRRNNGPEQTTTMALTASPNQWEAFIPGPTQPGDVIQYRIVATDSSALAKTSYAPENGYYAFHIMSGIKLIYSYPLDQDPGWTTTGLWAFGRPLGSGSYCRDPQSGKTGENVYGYNLFGDYENNLATAQYLTTTPINCKLLAGTTLKFWRRLGIESSSFDRANIRASNEYSDWVTVWEHQGASICDSDWIQRSYDISQYADGKSLVRVQWGMGPTDPITTYPGWNLDDIEIWAAVPPVKTIPQAKFVPDGQAVTIEHAVVAGSAGNAFYVIQKGTASGIRIEGSSMPPLGRIVDIIGVLETNADGERLIRAEHLIPPFAGPQNDSFRPISMGCKSVGGSALGLQQGVWNTLGPNNIGLLISVCGTVTQRDPEGRYFYLDDGSGIKDGTSTLGEPNKGIRIAYDPSLYLPGRKLRVTGFSSCFNLGEGKLGGLIRPRGLEDITVLPAP